MNRRFYYAVGMASGVFLLGGGVAEAGTTTDNAEHNADPKAISALLTDIFSPTGGLRRIAPSTGTSAEPANDATPGRAQNEVQPNTVNPLRHNGMTETETTPAGPVTTHAAEGRPELLPGFGGKSADGLGLLLSGLPGGKLLGKLTADDSPLGELISGGPLGTLMGGLKAEPAANREPSGAVTVDSPNTKGPNQDPVQIPYQVPVQVPSQGDDDTTDRRQPAPAGLLGTATPNPSTRHHADDTMTRGTVADEPVPGASDVEKGTVERRAPADGTPLIGGVFGPYGPLGQVELLGGDTLRGLPVVGELVGDGISLKTLNHIPALGEVVNQVWTQDSRQALPAVGNLPTVGELSRALIGGGPANGQTEAVGAPRSDAPAEDRAYARQATDKSKVTPQLLAMFGPEATGTHALSGNFHQPLPAGLFS